MLVLSLGRKLQLLELGRLVWNRASRGQAGVDLAARNRIGNIGHTAGYVAFLDVVAQRQPDLEAVDRAVIDRTERGIDVGIEPV